MFDNDNSTPSAEVTSEVSSNVNQKQEFSEIFSGMSNSDKDISESEAKEPTKDDTAKTVVGNDKTLTKPNNKPANDLEKNIKGSKSDRYGELTRKWREEQRRSKQLEKELADIKAGYKPVDRMSVANDAEWIDKQVQSKLEMTSKEIEAKRAKDEAENVERELFNHKITTQIDDDKIESFVSDYQTYIPKLYSAIPDELNYMAESEVGPLVIQDFLNYAKTDGFIESFVNAHPYKRMNILLQAEEYHKNKIKSNVNTSEVNVESVNKPKPKPVTPILGNNRASQGSLSQKAEFDKIFKGLNR